MIRRAVPMCLAGILVACGGSDTPDAERSDAPAAAPVPSSSPSSVPTPATNGGQPAPSTSPDPNAVVPAALQFSAPLLGGGDIELTTLAGRPVLLWFWAPW